MAQLKVFQDRSQIFEIELVKDKEYIAGRNDSCDIVLNKSSVSRQHLKIFFDGQSWKVQVLARFSPLLLNGEEKSELDLNESLSFYVDGFEFQFTHEVDERKGSALTAAPMESTATKISSDNTAIGTSVGESCLLVIDESQDEETLFSLEGNLWVIGRSSSCQIQIQEPKASRNHLEIARSSSGFTIMDLGSSNGTTLNGEKLKPQVTKPLQMGDQVRVGKTLIEFQIRDPRFESKLLQIPSHLAGDEEIVLENQMVPYPDFTKNFPMLPDGTPNVIKYDNPNWMTNFTKNKKNVRIVIGLFACLIIYSFTQEETGELEQSSIPNQIQNPDAQFNKLTKEQKKLLEDTRKLAKELYMQGKYESALIETKKMHELVPFYGDSREIEDNSKQAIAIKLEQDELTRRIEEARLIKVKVARITETCEIEHGKSNQLEEMQNCLAPALELDPENASIQELMNKVAQSEEQRKQRQLSQEELRNRIRTGNNMFQTAQKLEQSEKLLEALSMYEKYINSRLPDPDGNKIKAKQTVAKLKNKIKLDITARLGIADKFKAEEKYKEALQTLTRAMELDPSDNNTRLMYETVQQDLNRKMKTLYSDSVIEENLGNIESAKQKWRIIKDQDLEGNNYYMKAARKLNRYGN
ncbi:MAG: FHA domain-containing protein [Bdellovibrionales bacterium]